MAAKRKAVAVWENDLQHGKGRVSVGSGSLPEFPVTWASRVEQPEGKTSPEELLAAAQATCYAMALSSTLTKKGNPPDKLEVTAECTVDKVGEGFKVTSMQITVNGKVPGLDDARFKEAANAAEKGCPIANAIRNNVEITLKANLG